MPPVDFRLYLVTDRRQTEGRPLVPLLREALQAGLPAVQLRERDLGTRPLLALAEEVLRVVREAGAKLFINERADLAMALGADGVHLRSSSLPVREVRRVLGPTRLIGVSVHSTDEVVRVEGEGADFALLGPIYDTPSKRQYGRPIGLRPIEEAARRSRLPVLAIGGITPARVGQVRGAGAFGVGVVASIQSAGCVASVTRIFLQALGASR
jgi:thiamine-phosphate pyrophosphorylase